MNFPHESDSVRTSRVAMAHRKALAELARVTLRYQVHNELAAARHAASRAIVLAGALVLSACGGGGFDAGAALVSDDAGTAVLEHDAGSVDARSSDASDDAGDSSGEAGALVQVLFQVDAGELDAGALDQVDAGELDAGAELDASDGGTVCVVYQNPVECNWGTLSRCGGLTCCCR